MSEIDSSKLLDNQREIVAALQERLKTIATGEQFHARYKQFDELSRFLKTAAETYMILSSKSDD